MTEPHLETPPEGGSALHSVLRRLAQWVSSVDGRICIGLYVSALLLRLALVITTRTYPLFTSPAMDMGYHVEWARAILAGRPFVSDVFFRAPFYPYALAVLLWIGHGSLVFARTAQAMLGSFSPVVLYLLAREVGLSRPRAAIAGGLLATAWTAVYFDVELLLVVYEVLFDLLALLFVVRALKKRRHAFWLCGLCFGLSAVTRPNILAVAGVVWVLFLPLWPFRTHRRTLGRLAGLYLVMAAVIAPVTLHNVIRGGDFVLISSQAGVNFYIGNNPLSDGVTAVVPRTRASWWGGYHDTRLLAEQAEERSLNPSEISRYWGRLATSYMTAYPVRALRHFAWKTYLLTNAAELGNNTHIPFHREHLRVLGFNPIGLWLVLPLAMLGMVLGWRDRERL